MRNPKAWAVLAFCFLGILALVAVVQKRIQTTDTTQPPPEKTWAEVDVGEAEEIVLGVEELMKSPSLPKGEVCVHGVVSGKSKERQLLTLIDTAEFKRCKILTCAQLSLPVRWDGPMPELEQQVDVDGEIKKEAGQLVFVARSVHAIKEHTEDGQ